MSLISLQAQYVGLLATVDVNHDGRVSTQEFLSYFERQIKLPQKQQLGSIGDVRAVGMLMERCTEFFGREHGAHILREAFKVADTDRSGGLSLAELSSAMAGVTNMVPSNSQLLLLLDRIDVDHSGPVETGHHSLCLALRPDGSDSTGLMGKCGLFRSTTLSSAPSSPKVEGRAPPASTPVALAATGCKTGAAAEHCCSCTSKMPCAVCAGTL